MYQFDITACDTDSIFFKKKDSSAFTPEEIKKLNDSLNDQFDDLINWELNGYFLKMVVIKTKNYILLKESPDKDYKSYVVNGKTCGLKIKGSALKATNKEKALKEFIGEVIHCLLSGSNDYEKLYLKYVEEINNIKDMTRWVTKKTVTDKVLKSERTNEAKVRDAIEGAEYVEGDKIYTYYKSDDTLSLIENFDGDYSKDKLYKKLYDTIQVFDTILNMDLFPNFKLKRNKKVLDAL